MGILFAKAEDLRDVLLKNHLLNETEWQTMLSKSQNLNISPEELLVREGYLKQQELMELYINRFKRRPLSEIILGRQLVSPAQLDPLLKEWQQDEKGLLGALRQKNLLNAEQLAQLLAEKYELAYVELRDYVYDAEQFSPIPLEIMETFNFLPLKKLPEGYLLAIDDPSDVVKIDNLRTLLAVPLILKVANAEKIRELIEKNRGARGVLTEIAEDFKLQIIREEGEGEEEKIVVAEDLGDAQSPMIKLVNSIIFQAIERRVSDIHIESAEDRVVVKYRIDGVLYKAMDNLSKRFHDTLLSRLKIMAELNIAEKRVPQDGRFKIRYRGRTIDFRVSIMPSIFGEDAVIRILDKIAITLDLKSLGFSSTDLERFEKTCASPTA